MSKRRDGVKRYAEAIVRAGNGDKAAERLLRTRLKRNAETMPVSVLLAVSEALFGCRLEQLREEMQTQQGVTWSGRADGRWRNRMKKV
jgi:carbamate kinase